MICADAVGDFLQQNGFAAFRRRNDEPAIAFADRCEQIHDAHGEFVRQYLEFEALVGIQGRQVVEELPVADVFGTLVVDRLHFEQREEAFAFLRRSHLAADGVAGAQSEFLDLARRHVNVVRRRKVVVVRCAEEAVPVGQHFEDAFAEGHAIFLGLRLEDLENQFLLFEIAGPQDIEVLRDLGKLGDALGLEFGNVHCHGSIRPSTTGNRGRVAAVGRNTTCVKTMARTAAVRVVVKGRHRGNSRSPRGCCAE